MDHRSPHVIVVYVLLAILAGLLIYTEFFRPAEEKWECAQVMCSVYATAEQWTQENCFDAPMDDGSSAVVCRVQFQDGNRLVPLSQLNLSALNVCQQYTCVREVRVRSVNYSINATQ